MPITQLPVPKNPLLQEREAYLLVEIYSETNFEHVELDGIDPTLPRTLQNFHLMFTTFSERLCHVPHSLHSMQETHIVQQEGHFQAEGLLRLETNEINKSWRVAQPFQTPSCETGFHNEMVNRLSYPRETLAESYEGTGWAFSSKTLSSTPHICVHNQGYEILKCVHFSQPYHSVLESSTHMNWKLSRCFDPLTHNGKEFNAPLQHHWNHAFDYHHRSLFCKDPKYKNLHHTQRLLKAEKTQDELNLIYAILAGNTGGRMYRRAGKEGEAK